MCVSERERWGVREREREKWGVRGRVRVRASESVRERWVGVESARESTRGEREKADGTSPDIPPRLRIAGGCDGWVRWDRGLRIGGLGWLGVVGPGHQGGQTRLRPASAALAPAQHSASVSTRPRLVPTQALALDQDRTYGLAGGRDCGRQHTVCRREWGKRKGGERESGERGRVGKGSGRDGERVEEA